MTPTPPQAGSEKEPNVAPRKGARVVCTVCGIIKKPMGRSAPRMSHYCDHECPGYYQDPQPDTLWPGEQDDSPAFGGCVNTESETPRMDGLPEEPKTWVSFGENDDWFEYFKKLRAYALSLRQEVERLWGEIERSSHLREELYRAAVGEGCVMLLDKDMNLLELRNERAEAAEADAARLREAHTWYCGCGHTNGVNLPTCAACGRDPTGEYRGKPIVS